MKTASLAILITLLATFVHPEDTPWPRHTVDAVDKDTGKAGADGVRLGDINKDGLPDIVTGWEEGGAIRVCLHPGAGQTEEPWKAVTVGNVKSPEDAVFADLDGDGILDVVSATEGKSRAIFFHWAPSNLNSISDASAWQTIRLPLSEPAQMWMFTLPADIDGDGDTDLIAGSKQKGASISWLENPGAADARKVGSWKEHRVADAGWIMSLRILEEGSNRYLVYSDRKGSNSGIFLSKFLDRSPWLGKPALIGASGEEVMFLDIAELNGDGKLDLIAAIRPDKVRIFYQPDEALSLWKEVSELKPLSPTAHGTSKAVLVGDMDDDGNPDFVITCEHADGEKHGVLLASANSEFRSVSGPEGVKFDRIELLDMDGDGDLDILTCEERTGLGVFWYENPLFP